MTHRCGLGPEDLGPLLLDALPPAEQQRLEQRRAGCPGCAADLASLRPVVAAMAAAAATVELDDGPDPRDPPPGADLPDAAALERMLAAVRAERPGLGRRPARPWRRPVVVAAATVLVAAMVSGGLALLGRGGDGQVLTLTGSSGARASARLDQRSWGTAMRLQVSGLRPGTAYGAWLAYPDGRRLPAGTFVAQRDGSADVDLVAALALDQTAAVGVTALGGADVLAATLP